MAADFDFAQSSRGGNGLRLRSATKKSSGIGFAKSKELIIVKFKVIALNNTAFTHTPKLTLVGAGPGDPDLISIKGVKALASADVVLYDALTHPDLLVYAPAKALKVSVGKRGHCTSMTQEDINKLIVDYALSYGHVVRLKGGDPFIFGRGQEEIEHAESFNIPVEVIPGISSVSAVPGLNRIPLTTRGINQSYWAVTGTTRDGGFSDDLYHAARSSATVVILMGMHNLKEITDLFAKEGKANTPAAIIQNGSLENEQIVLGRVSNIAALAETAGVGSPAVIVFGEVVALHPDYESEYLIKIENTKKGES